MKRADYAADVRDRAIQYREQKNRCSTPFDLPAKATADMNTGAVGSDAGGFFEVIRNVGDANGKVWYMVDCFDYTNIKLNSQLVNEESFNPAGYRPDISNILNDGKSILFLNKISRPTSASPTKDTDR